jgi:UDP-2,3-diacylglucosamine pyrophosphatase LpxH
VIHQTASGQNFLVTHGDEFDCVIQKSRWLAALGSMAYELLLESNTLVNIVRSAWDLPYWSLSAS